MPSTRVGTVIGTTGNATFKGIFGATVTWTGISSTSRSGTVFNAWDLTAGSDTDQTKGNHGEWVNTRHQNKRLSLKIDVKPVSTTAALAMAIAEDPPARDGLITIASANLTVLNSAYWQLAGDPSSKETPDGDAIMSLDIWLQLDDQNAAVAVAVLS